MHTPPSLQEIQDALQFIDPDIPRDDWAKVGMGIKAEFGDDGFGAFDSWSQGGQSYKSQATKDTWSSIKAGGGITIASVLKLARDGGYEPDKHELSPNEVKQRQLAYAKRAKQREVELQREADERAQWHEVVAVFAEQLLAQFARSVKSNRYLATKKVSAFDVLGFHSAFVAVIRPNFMTEVIVGREPIQAFFNCLPPKESRDFSFLSVNRGDLAIPLRDIDGKLWNIQVINEGGTKLFLKHGRKSGCFHFIGEVGDDDADIVMAEGYATTASIHMAFQCKMPCVVALDAGNLLPVGKAINARYPNKRLVFCADNDLQTKGNPGVTKANKAASVVGGVVVVPDLSALLETA